MVKPIYWSLAIALCIGIAVLTFKYQAGFAVVLVFCLFITIHYATKREKPRRRRVLRRHNDYDRLRPRSKAPTARTQPQLANARSADPVALSQREQRVWDDIVAHGLDG